MNKLVMASLLCPLVSVPARALPPPNDRPSSLSGPLMGAYQPAPCDSQLVQDARSFVQRHLASMTLDEVTEAYTQVVAGLNVKLVCTVSGEDGPASWQFVAYRSLDGQWHFRSANHL